MSRSTPDSARPPKVGERREEPRAIADVDLDALRAAMADDVVDEPAVSTVNDTATNLRISALTEDNSRLRGVVAELESALKRSGAIKASAFSALDDLQRVHASLAAILKPKDDEVVLVPIPAAPEPPADAKISAVWNAPRKACVAIDAPAGETKLGGSPMKILHTLATATLDGSATRTQLAFLAGYAHGGGSYARYLTTLRSAGAIEDADGKIHATTAGYALLGGSRQRRLKSSRDVLEIFRTKLGGGPRKIFDALVAVWPAALARDEIAKRTGYEASGGSFARYLTTLSSAQLIERRNDGIRLVDELFPSGKPA